MATPIPSPVRLSPQVQRIQQSSPYHDIQTNAAISPLRSRANTQHLRDMTSHAHPEMRRWENPGGWGARHLNDIAPFTLWSEETRTFRGPSKEEMSWIDAKFESISISDFGWLLYIQTDSPPRPIPLTLGSMPVIFARPGEELERLTPSAPYPNPRVPDPCPNIRLPLLTDPTKSQTVDILTAITSLANVRAANFLPFWTIFELETGDGRSYGVSSLPGTVAGRTALYHHEDLPFFGPMRSLARPRLIDPAQASTAGIRIQDTSNYLRYSTLTPGCRVECGFGLPGTPNEFSNAATTCGVKLRNLAGEEVLTVSNHGFLTSKEVHHPFVNGGDLIGEVVDTRPELDIALVKLTPASSARFTNSCYFQSEPPTRLLEPSEVPNGSWSEVDGMSSGLFSLMKCGSIRMRPVRPIGHGEIPFIEWDTRFVNIIFGNVNTVIADGVCGAPIVDVESGGVSGVFHQSNGAFAISAAIDDLIAEGWGLA